MTVAVTLFAVLELYKQGELTWTQEQPFGEITVSALAPAPRRGSRQRDDSRGRPARGGREVGARGDARGAPVPEPGASAPDALAEATGAELHEVVTALERLREYYEFERRGLVLRELAGGWASRATPTPSRPRGRCWPGRAPRR